VTERPSKDGVVAVLEDRQGRYLFIRRGWTLKRAPGVWCFPGGEVEPGETLEQALAREMQEELGLAVRVGAKVHESVSPNGEYLLHWLRVEELEPGGSLQPNPVEVAEVVWLPPTSALGLDPMLPTLQTWLKQRN
jgi:8-oxo-dGTP pyrophosphatase MutT (NUDIX family)